MPTYQRLKRHLAESMEIFEPLNDNQREAPPRLDLIIFADEIPEGPFENTEEAIVGTAGDLNRLRANK